MRIWCKSFDSGCNKKNDSRNYRIESNSRTVIAKRPKRLQQRCPKQVLGFKIDGKKESNTRPNTDPKQPKYFNAMLKLKRKNELGIEFGIAFIFQAILKPTTYFGHLWLTVFETRSDPPYEKDLNLATCLQNYRKYSSVFTRNVTSQLYMQ